MRNLTATRFFIAALCWTAATALSGQHSDIQVRVLGFEEGLSHRNVFQINQDTNGFLWFATFNGLNRYDGYSFSRIEKIGSGLTPFSSMYTGLTVDPQNRIWVYQPNFVHYWDPATDETGDIPIHSGNLGRGEERTPVQLAVLPDQTAWMVVYVEKEGRAYLERWSAGGERLKQIPLPGQYENHPLVWHKGFLYLAAWENELWKLNDSGDLIDKYNFAYRGYDRTRSRIADMRLDSENRLWVLLRGGQLYRQTESGFDPHEEAGLWRSRAEEFLTFLVEPKGDVWLAGPEFILHFDSRTKRITNHDQAVREITQYPTAYRQFFPDPSGVVWVATDFGAVKLVRPRKLFATYLSGGDKACSSGFCSMRGMAEGPDGALYFSFYNSIEKLPPGASRTEPLFPDRTLVNSPYGLAWFQNGLVTGNGLYIDPVTGRTDTLFYASEAQEGVVLTDPEGVLWAGYGTSLFRCASLEKATTPFVQLPHTISYLHRGARSRILWIGTHDGGLYSLDPASGGLKSIEVNLSHQRVLACLEDSRGLLWVATANGLNLLDLVSGAVRVFQDKHGLPNNFINGILPEGDSCLWISTDQGLCRMTIDGKDLTCFYEQDGLPANEFNRISFLRSSDGRLFFGGLNGVAAFTPGPSLVEEKQKHRGKLLVTYFSKYDGWEDSMIQFTSGWDWRKGIDLSFRDKFFTFGFALADYNNPRENQYSYILEGYESSWSDPGAVNFARYQNIPPGNYVFKVKAVSGPNESNSEILEVPVHIDQAFYRSYWFLALCALLMILAIYGIMRYRLYTTEKREKILEAQVRARTVELEREKHKSEELLRNILPADTAEELKTFGFAKARRYEQVTVMFSDFKGFSQIAAKLEPEELVAEIDFCFAQFDRIMETHGLEKIKTIGDAYLCVGGLGQGGADAAVQVVEAALDIQAFMQGLQQAKKPFFQARIGIHTGPVVAGIVGIKKFAYDIWGDTVNIANRMETHGEVGMVNISQATYQLVSQQFECIRRGQIPVRGQGEMEMYFVKRGTK